MDRDHLQYMIVSTLIVATVVFSIVGAIEFYKWVVSP
jgi:hypothetical protein